MKKKRKRGMKSSISILLV